MKLISFILLISIAAFAANNHDDHDDHGDEHEKSVPAKDEHDHKEEAGAHSDEDAHAKSEGEKHDEHGDHDEHGEEEGAEEENSAIGPDKGILAKGPNGFKLSPEAIKNFGFKTADLNTTIITLPKQALVHVKDDKFIYRIRDEWIKRQPVKVLSKTPTTITVELPDYAPNDKIITTGNGFIRTTEIVVEEGATDGHAH